MRIPQKRKFFSLFYWFVGIFILSTVSSAVLISSSSMFGEEENSQTGKEDYLAPMPEGFLRYLEDQKRGKKLPKFTEDGYPIGYIPDPIEISFPEDKSEDSPDAFPSFFSLVGLEKVPDVRDQGGCGSCWAHAGLAMLETFLLYKRNQIWDFAELHLIRNKSWNYPICEGGNLSIVMAYLSRWCGPVLENLFPYPYSPLEGNGDVQKHVQDVVYIPIRNSSRDNKKIKKNVKKYGAAYVNYYHVSSCYNPDTYAFYNTGETKQNGHAVTIVGWDDNYSRNNFNTTPSLDGAFIVRNSWGADWGEDGYYYVSYDDAHFGRRYYSAVVKNAESPDNYKDIYYYDPLGMTGSFGNIDENAWFANIFKARKAAASSDKAEQQKLAAVSFYARGLTTNYTIYIYTNVNAKEPRSGKLELTQSGRFKEPGYYTVSLKKKIALIKGKRFSVVVKVRTKDYLYPIPIERPIKGATSKAKAKKKQSFRSYDGESWKDVTLIYKNTNVCLKAFTI